MKILFNNKRLYTNLILGIIWIGFAIFKVLAVGADNFNWFDYGYLVIGIIYIGHYLYDLKVQYMTVENGAIWRNKLYGFGRKIDLNQIERIRQWDKNYTLITETGDFVIDTKLIEEKSLVKLNKILADLDLPSEKTIF